jgi:uncharacterized protein YraI
MNRRHHPHRLSLALAGLVASGLACSLTGAATHAPTAPAPAASPTTATLPRESEAATATQALLEQPSPSPAATETPTGRDIVLSATGGNLNIRRGPGPAYDVVGFLLNGQASPASGRNDPASWVYVAIPDKPGALGWVSVDSRCVSLAPTAAPVQSLPVRSVDLPKPAYLRNCTFHPMEVDPGGLVLKPRTDAPANRQQVNPGAYTALDQSVANAEARPVSLKEGQTKDITTDGLDNRYACP